MGFYRPSKIINFNTDNIEFKEYKIVSESFTRWLGCGGMLGKGGMYGEWGGCAWQERQPLQQTVHILLECILVSQAFVCPRGRGVGFPACITGHMTRGSASRGVCIQDGSASGGWADPLPQIHGILRDTVNKLAVRYHTGMHSCYSCKSLAVPRVEDDSYLTEKTRLSSSPLRRVLGLVYTEHQPQCCDVASDIALNKLLRFFYKSGESLQHWAATPIDQM